MEITPFRKNLTTLRKSHAITQKELAEKLSVSDKTISRWERGDGEPDLAAILALSDLFGVTCDQLLRDGAGSPQPCSPQDSITPTLIRYKNQTLLSGGIALLGLLAAALGNFLLENALLGFILGACFCLAGGIAQWFFAGNALASIGKAFSQSRTFRWLLVKYGLWTAGTVMTVTAFCLPLLLLPPWMGLEYGALYLIGSLGWVPLGLLSAMLALSVLPLGYQLLKRRLCPDFQPEKRQAVFTRALAVIMLLTLGFQLFGCSFLWHPAAIAQGQEFQQETEFLEWMRQRSSSTLDSQQEIGETKIRLLDGSIFLGFEGQALRILTDSNGQEVLRFPQRNPTVAGVRYLPGNGTVSGLTAISSSQYHAAKITCRNVTLLLLLLYPLEILAAFALFRRKTS